MTRHGINDSLPHAVVLGLSPTGLYIARELGILGVSLLGVDREFGCAAWSRHFRYGDGIWYEGNNNELLHRLGDYAARLHKKPVLIPSNDYFIEFIHQNYTQLDASFSLFEGYRDVAAAFLDKSRFQALCRQNGIIIPRTWTLPDVSELENYIADITFPCLLKPSLIHVAKRFMHGKKVLVARNPEELRSLTQQLPDNAGEWLIQEIIPGEESRILLVAGYEGCNADASDSFTARKLRQYPPGFGSASQAVSEHCSESRELASRLISATGFKGVYAAEFKRDTRDNKLKLIEINPRPALWFQLANSAGKHLIAYAYCNAAGLPLPLRQEQRNGIIWQYVLKDWAAALFYRFKGRGFIFQRPTKVSEESARQRCWPVFSVNDPLPFIAELIVYAKKALGRWH